FRVGEEKVALNSSRVGIIQLGVGYTQKVGQGSEQRYARTEVERVSTLVHEARHSDCTGGLWKSDLERFRKGDMPTHRECGHLHINCPPDHALAGLPACDGAPWGAYAIGGLYSAGVFKTCKNCDEKTKALAKADALDQLSRVQGLE